ncbi:hypothetical protein EDB86DRAFT_1705708 [Lactarius hatsudake]|nr:hypothetical protein EDB86DRAFT_1705708 [Lactarius hatsudake]
MNIPDPLWKKKTRPCPFYSQGRCVFAASCGFLHDAKFKGSVDRQSANVSLIATSSRSSTSSMDSVVKVPIAVHSPTSLSSPAHSPRMANLLSALQGIIGPDPQESTELSASVGGEPLCDISDASHLLGTVEGMSAVRDENMEHVLGQGGDAPGRSQPQNSADVIGGVRDFTNDTSPAGDSGILEDEKRNLSSPPGLLSPVQIGTVPPVLFPHSGSDTALACNGPIDFDSAEPWVGPTPFSLSPPHLSQPGSTLDLLSSPFGSPVSRVLPKRLSSSASRKQSNPPTLRDFIEILSPPSISTVDSQRNVPSENTSLMPASQAWHSLLHSPLPDQKGVEDAIPSNGMTKKSDLAVDVSNSSPTESSLASVPSSDIPVLKSPITMTSYEDPVDTQFTTTTMPNEDSLGDREECLSAEFGGTVESSQTPSQLSSMGVEANHLEEPLPHPTPMSTDIQATSTHSASVSERSPVSPGATAERKRRRSGCRGLPAHPRQGPRQWVPFRCLAPQLCVSIRLDAPIQLSIFLPLPGRVISSHMYCHLRCLSILAALPAHC